MAVCALSVAGGRVAAAPAPPPELDTAVATSDLGMVATGSPEATRAGVEILERGGNAVDAAVAAALTLAVADSDASGLAGATVALVHLAGGPTIAIDGSSRTPSLLDLDQLREMKEAGRNFGYETIAVPTTLATLEHLRSRYGTMGFAELAAPAIAVAERGYALSEIQIAWTEVYYDNILAASIYMPFLAMEDGRSIGRPGDRHCQPELAATLRRLAREGVVSFYRGAIADQIEADIAANGGFLRKSDLAMFRVRELAPLRGTYRRREVLSFPPPGGGGKLIAMLRILEGYPSASLAADSTERHHTVIEAARIAHFETDPGGDSGLPGALARGSARGREPGAAPLHAITAGRVIPQAELAPGLPEHCVQSGESTTQVSVMDSEGNVVSLTQTLGRSFGAKVATPGLGFPYNSFLETFHVTDPSCPGFIAPRMPCPNDMAPTIVFEDGAPWVALGTPGSSRIPSILASVLSNLVDRGLELGEATAAPRVLWGGIRQLRAFVEVAGPVTAEQAAELASWGHEGLTVVSYPPAKRADIAEMGGVNAVAFEPRAGTFIGVVDPRRGGLAEGPQVVAARD
jgi:gamma-glutamyltranspeptidase/glutathione hydrolase